MCKFYQGSEDKKFEARLKKMFAKVFREKPESSRSVSFNRHCLSLRFSFCVLMGLTLHRRARRLILLP